MTQEALLYYDIRRVTILWHQMRCFFLWHKKRYCIVTQGELVHYDIIYIYCMLVREMWKFIQPRVSYSLRATPKGNMILVD